MWQDQLIRTVHLIALHTHLDKKSLQIHTVTRKGQVSCIWHPRRLQGLPVSHSTGAAGSSPGAGGRERIKQAGHKADHSHLSSAQVNDRSYTSTPQYAFVSVLNEAREQMYLYPSVLYKSSDAHTAPY